MKKIKGSDGLNLSGRDFRAKELRLIKNVISLYPNLSRTELAKTIGELLTWHQADGEPKWRSCLKVLEKLENSGEISLPLLKESPLKGSKRKILITKRTDSGIPLGGRVEEYGSILINPVKDREEGRLWSEYIQRYHYLGYKGAFGSQQKYFIRFISGELLGCLLYSASAWSVSCRDKWIGWDKEGRSRRLHLVLNNSRFLIFPWIRIKNLASKILSLSSKQIRGDWFLRYNYHPVLLESFVDNSRFCGTCYKASNWRYLGVSKGRGRQDYNRKYLSSPKDVYVYPLTSNFREELKGEV